MSHIKKCKLGNPSQTDSVLEGLGCLLLEIKCQFQPASPFVSVWVQQGHPCSYAAHQHTNTFTVMSLSKYLCPVMLAFLQNHLLYVILTTKETTTVSEACMIFSCLMALWKCPGNYNERKRSTASSLSWL